MSEKPQIEARRGYAGAAILERGFRPFFFIAGVWAIVALGVWLLVLTDTWRPVTDINMLAWHSHELIFGYGGSVIIGFALTAIPNWTGRLPVRGVALGILALGWLAARLGALSALMVPGAIFYAAALELIVLAAFVGIVFREITAGGNWRNLPVAIMFSLLFLACLTSHLGRLGMLETIIDGRRAGLAVLILLITLIGGRIIPSFTGNWLKSKKETALPVPFGRFDAIVIGLTAVALIAWLAGISGPLAAAIMGTVAALHAIRMGRWRGLSTFDEPLVTILHAAYLWIPIGFALIGLSEMDLILPTAALHAWTIGAVGGMTLAVMTRATLGHSGRSLTASKLTILTFILLHAAAMARIIDAVVAPGGWVLMVAGTCWIGAYVLYLVEYAPVMWRRA